MSLSAIYIRKMEKKALKKRGVKPPHSVLDQVLHQGGSESEDEEDYPDQEGVANPVNFLEESISMLERTSLKLYPVIKEVIKRLIVETKKPASAAS